MGALKSITPKFLNEASNICSSLLCDMEIRLGTF